RDHSRPSRPQHGDHRRRQRGEEASAFDQGDDAGRDHRQGHARPRLERGHPVRELRAEPDRLPDRRRRHEGSDLQEVRQGSLMAPVRERPRLKARYDDELRSQLQSQLGLDNIMEVPRLEKIVLNCGVGRATQQASLLYGAVADLTIITGQKPLVTKAKKSIAGFKLRAGNAIGAKVTLRADRMWEFYDRLVRLAITQIL